MKALRQWYELMKEKSAIHWRAAVFFDTLSGVEVGYEPFDDEPFDDEPFDDEPIEY